MGFGGGGSSSLPNHQHSNVPLTGGPLDLSNVTVGSLAAGSVVYSNGAALQELVKPAVPAGEVLSYPALATAPSWGSAASGTWEIAYSARDNVAANTLDTGYVDLGHYRAVKYFWSACYSAGAAALDLRFYNPDGNEENGAFQGASGFYNNNTFFSSGNTTSYDLTNGNAIEDDGDIILELTLLSASVNNKGAGGMFSMSQRSAGASGDATYCIGNLFQAHNSALVSTDLFYFNGIKDISGVTWTDGILTILGMGNNTV